MGGSRSEDSGRRSVSVWLSLTRFGAKVERILADRLRGWGLNNAQFGILARVAEAEGITQQELAASLLVTKGNIAQLLGRMEERGLIERRAEGRVNRSFLTDQGRCLHREVVPAYEDSIGELFGGLSSGEQDQLLRLLRKLDRSSDGEWPTAD